MTAETLCVTTPNGVLNISVKVDAVRVGCYELEATFSTNTIDDRVKFGRFANLAFDAVLAAARAEGYEDASALARSVKLRLYELRLVELMRREGSAR
jgi:hypothetical protein